MSKQLDVMFRSIAMDNEQPIATYRALESLVNSTVGVKLFTLMEFDYHRNVAWRSYSNRPKAYPVTGEKPMLQNQWSDIVERRRQIFVANCIDEIAAVFPDYELILELGCESCINIPIMMCGELVGTLNCLNGAGHYTPQRVAAAQSLMPAGTLAFLTAAAFSSAGETNG